MENSFKYAFILGHVPELSRLEIVKVLGARHLSFSELFYHQEVLVLETAAKLEVDKLQQQLGGTIKIAVISALTGAAGLEPALLDLLENIRVQQTTASAGGVAGKFQFGFSLYSSPLLRELSRIGLNIKKHLKKAKSASVRFIASKEKNLSSVIVAKENLLTKGADIVVIKTGARAYFIGQTVTAQDFGAYSQRDYGRPGRDDRQGMLPPKLAQIMINLSQAPLSGVLLDPFCGSGTVLQEALLLGYTRLIGSDVSAKAVAQAKNNLQWLKTKYHLPGGGIEVYQQDARSLSLKIKNSSVNAIVSEPYLGENRKSRVLKQNLEELADLYFRAFQEFYKVLRAAGAVVFIFPVIAGRYFNLLAKIEKIGFVQEKLSVSPRGALVYQRPGQRVLREIVVFVKI